MSEHLSDELDEFSSTPNQWSRPSENVQNRLRAEHRALQRKIAPLLDEHQRCRDYGEASARSAGIA